jgi:hypothetical protein
MKSTVFTERGRSITHIADFLVMNWRTVKKYLSMDEFEYEAFLENQSNRQKDLALMNIL